MASQPAGPFKASPLRHKDFRRYYYGSVGTALGFTVLSTAAAWLMATLTPSALMVALVQTASTLPTLIFGLIAGSLAGRPPAWGRCPLAHPRDDTEDHQPAAIRACPPCGRPGDAAASRR